MKQITCNFCGDTYPVFDVAHVCSKGPYAPKLKPKMNERIKELAEQAKKSVPHGLAVDKWIETYNEIFANLIIEECGRALNPMLRDMISRGQAHELIKEHFK